jgi:O-antigen/teichoic acid export membrane protein
MTREQPMATATPSTSSARRRLGEHFGDPLFQTGYYLILGTGITGVLGIVFWALAAHTYPARVVGLNSAVISAMMLVSGACTLGLSAVLVRYLPVAGRSTRTLVVRSYAVTVALSLLFGAAAALTSPLWSAKLDFLAGGVWLVGFTLATAATTVFTLQDSVLTGLKSAKWIPVENSLYSVAKLLLLVVLAGALPQSGLFVAWNASLPAAIVLISILIFRRLIPAVRSDGSLDRRQLFGMARGNYAGMLFDLAATFYLPILVANITTAAETAYFYVPWMISVALELVALSMMASLTVEAATDMPRLRQLTQRALRQTFRIVCPLAVVTAIAAPWALLAFGQDYADAGAPLLRALMLGQIPNVLVVLGISVARIEHRGGTVVAILAAQAVLVLGLSAILVSGTGIKAVGVAWFVSQTAIAIVLLGSILRPLLLPQRWAGKTARSPADG